MRFLPKFYYNQDAPGGAGGLTDVDGQNGSSNTSNDPQIPEDVLAELNGLREYRKNNPQQPAAKTAEEISREQEVEKADLLKFSVDNKLMSVDDFTTYENLKAKTDQDLVFESFVAEEREDNPDVTSEELKEAFEAKYKLNSTDEKVKTRGLAKIQKEASGLRSPYEASYTKATKEYKEQKEIRESYPKFNKFVDDQVSAIPEKVALFKTKNGDGDVVVEVEITKEIREEIAKTFKNDKTFFDYTNSDAATVKTKLEKKVNSCIKERMLEEVGQKVWTLAEGAGRAKGSNAGADISFGLKQTTSGKKHEAVVRTIQEDNDKISSVRARIGR